MDNIQILWVDDEIDLLKPHILFLEAKGYQVDTANNGSDALDMVQEKRYQMVFLDENMPGMDGLETLQHIKEKFSTLPVVMITKSEEESIMEDAIGSQISDYLIKPVNPNQILLTLKKHLENRRLVNEKTTSNYQQEFRQLAMDLSMVRDIEGWEQLFKRLTYWELELDKLEDESLNEILRSQKSEANAQFFRFVQNNYEDWFAYPEDAPIMSHTLVQNWVRPSLDKDQPFFLVVIDNLRYDQWKVIQPEIEKYFSIEEDRTYWSILPSATQFARNSLFAGLMPAEIKKRFPDKWVEDNEDDEGKNNYEADFFADNLKRLGFGSRSMGYEKVTNHNYGKKLSENLNNLLKNEVNVIVYNFVDMLSHAKTDMKVIRELADNDKAYRSLTLSWFRNSPLLDMLRQLSEKKIPVLLTTDHGTINVVDPTKVVGDRSLNTNLRYKSGRGMSYQGKDVLEIKVPEAVHLPKQNINSAYIFAKEDLFFAYPNNFNHYVKYYRNTYQHGGVSLEEMIIPFVNLSPKS
ncbi:T9SS response regulator signal transducer PorX [Croceimicrobium hydrocarbonivorans]|uniref:Bifunctional response regulator/alkaline phosphatase family protein n=1 Tax=Croceimicrobium hydrocarbonivorans TaxID=2761580 RepID=A0A7H0VHX8_9FLAO|nr:bifunctional response regulator/alkaline phosphatase family protein [Croceimicrobium hydrocarbonivorans]QNR25326.1 bifunctional response regulator/alkaline phosphatase family protein [Croceimicrobium hydrocarbonivorans]